MNIKNMKMMKAENSFFCNEVKSGDTDAIYCEMKFKRDRSSFAGMVFKFTNNNGIIEREFERKLIWNVNAYEKMYIGYELDYIKAIQRIFNSKEKNYGLEILFLVFSDVRSSQIIFEELMKSIDENADKLKKLE